MPRLEAGRLGAEEKAWGQEIGGEKDYQEKWQDAEAKLQTFLTDYNANSSMIPLEDYNNYLEEAKFYQEVANMHPGDVNKKLLMAADIIIKESPIKYAA